MKVLYVDDSTMALKMMAKAMDGFAELVRASTLSMAKEAVATQRIDCILTDNMLTDGQGTDFAKYVRALPEYRMTPIILISANVGSQIAYSAMRAGINQCLSKPVDPVELRSVIAEQVREPTIHQTVRAKIHATCVAWEDHGRFYQHSLDIGQTADGASPEEAKSNMEKLIEAAITKGEHGFNVSSPKLVTLILNNTPQPEA